MKAPTGKLAFAYRTISELEAERDRLRAEVEALRNRSDLSCDRAYRNGMQRGYAFGSEGDDVGYQRSMALYCDGIHAAITAKDGQP